MKFDDVLTVLGDFGRYQQLVFVALCLPIVLVGMQILSPVFTLATPRHRCAIPGFPNDTFDIQSDQQRQLVDYFIPVSADDTLSSCNIYDREVNKSSHNGTSIKSCDSWVYDNSVFIDTVITETNLVCYRAIYKAHATTALNIGSLFGYLIMSPTADRFGRKMVYMAEVVLMSVSATMLIWLPSIYLFIFIRGMIGFGFGVFYNIAYVYAMEFIGPSKRTVCGMMINYFWAIGLLIQTGMAYGLRSWRHLQLTMSLPFFAFLAYWWILPKSVRWLLSKQKIEESRTIIKRIASVNRVTLKSQHFDIEIQDNEFKEVGFVKTLLELFRHRTLAIRSCIVFLNWCVVSLLYYGLSLNVGNLGGNLYLNFAFSAVVEAVAYTLSIPGIVYIGRKKFHCSCMMIGGVTLLLTIVPELYGDPSVQSLVIVLAMIGKMVSAAAYATVYLFTAELFPTVVRSTTMGVSAFFAGVGGMLAPYIVVLGDMLEGPFAKILPLLIFGVASMVAGLSALILPETGNIKLPDTLQDIRNYSRDIPDEKGTTKSEPLIELHPQSKKASV